MWVLAEPSRSWEAKVVVGIGFQRLIFAVNVRGALRESKGYSTHAPSWACSSMCDRRWKNLGSATHSSDTDSCYRMTNQPVSIEPRATIRRKQGRGLLLIGALRLLEGLLVLAMAIGALKLLH